MANWIENVFAYLKESEKTVLINKSGSTPNSSMEKIRSGQSYLYEKYGMESEIIDVRLFMYDYNRCVTPKKSKHPACNYCCIVV